MGSTDATPAVCLNYNSVEVCNSDIKCLYTNADSVIIVL